MPCTLVWTEGCVDWQPLSSVLGLSGDAHQQSAPGSVTAARNGDNELEKLQREVTEVETEAIVNVDDEIPGTPPEGEDEFTDDGGTHYKWDRTLRVWVPQENSTAQKTDGYNPEDMVFVQDEEVFPVVNPDDFPQLLAVNVDDVPEKETADAAGQTDNARKNGKRKSPETDDKKPLEKKGQRLRYRSWKRT